MSRHPAGSAPKPAAHSEFVPSSTGLRDVVAVSSDAPLWKRRLTYVPLLLMLLVSLIVAAGGAYYRLTHTPLPDFVPGLAASAPTVTVAPDSAQTLPEAQVTGAGYGASASPSHGAEQMTVGGLA